MSPKKDSPILGAALCVVLATTALAAACSRDPRPHVEKQVADSVRYDLGGSYYARAFTLRDGTRCLITPEGGLSCDWRGRAPLVECDTDTDCMLKNGGDGGPAPRRPPL